ncbi:uncharacterized protein Z520_08445 [Fonsecaea multimorphosa CBS 102226]|uniref:Transcription factor domain-containing protein n=1 Tax=Fonsecaea multimorphosa CBS 102226 TaxID=1442371 RepID=A0A0D2JQV0_9EURO|nr:uncharacterized protein Z520_08445 [Fonsecaea multimorphosa CBS 102226]KIX95737.1 hypothetical protein Z520_08445 [Fonsecaea multimorphosa CBS 102226]OAL21475.1 hypothetical protein AYO22_07871 [Fonsecaea multimorphosa]
MCDDSNHRPTRTKPASSSHKICIPFLLNWASPTSGLTDTFKPTSDDLVVHASPRSHDDIAFRPEAGTEFNDYLPLPLTLDDSLIDFGLDAGVSAPLSPSFILGMPDQMSLSAIFPVIDRRQDQDPIVSLTEQVDSPYPFNDSGMDRNLSAEFADHLTALTLSLPQNHPEHAPSLNLALGMSTLSSINISRFLQLYFHHWNRHSPIVHPGTFDVLNASLPLLFVMTLTGALFSLSPDAVTVARSMLELAEEFAFRDSDFQKVASGTFPEGVDQRRRALQAFQAAFCAAQLQLREGNMWKRKCVRTFRFDQIICAVRTMGLHNGDLLTLDVSSKDTGLSDWNRFAEDESRLR